MSDINNALKCSIDGRKYPPSSYRLPDDGKKWRHLCEQRRKIALELASYANGDGSNISVGIKRMIRELEIPRPTMFRRLGDLRRLGVLPGKDGLTGEHGTALRSIDFSQLPLPPEVSDSLKAEVSDRQKSQIAGVAEVSDSDPEVSDRPPEVSPIRETQPLPSSDRKKERENSLSLFPKARGQETKTLKLADQVAALAFAENSGVSFNGKSRLAIEQGLSEYDATDKELSLTVPEIVRQMDDFQLRNAGGILAASLSGRILALRNAASKEREDEISLEEANRIVDENLAKKKAKEDAEAEKRRAEEEWEAAHANEI